MRRGAARRGTGARPCPILIWLPLPPRPGHAFQYACLPACKTYTTKPTPHHLWRITPHDPPPPPQRSAAQHTAQADAQKHERALPRPSTSMGSPVDILDQMSAILAPNPNLPRVCFTPYLRGWGRGGGVGVCVGGGHGRGGAHTHGHLTGRAGLESTTLLLGVARNWRGARCGPPPRAQPAAPVRASPGGRAKAADARQQGSRKGWLGHPSLGWAGPGRKTQKLVSALLGWAGLGWAGL